MKSPFVRRSRLDRTFQMYLEERATREERISELENRITRTMQVLSAQDRGTTKGGSGIVIARPGNERDVRLP
jgi:hypothetical protein